MPVAHETATSADGTRIAFERTGEGHPVILIGGAFSQRSAAAPLAAALAPHLTAVSYDRRGRGDSGDAPAYAVEREIEDLSAVIDAVGGRAGLFGHSSGACLALEAAARGLPLDGVAAYEPPYIPEGYHRPGADLAVRLRALVESDRRDDAVALFQAEAIGLPPEMVEGFRGTEMWASLTGLAHTLAYDVVVVGPRNVLPAERFTAISVPVLVIAGTASFDWMLSGTRVAAATIPGARHLAVAGADHGTPGSHPGLLAPELVEFFS